MGSAVPEGPSPAAGALPGPGGRQG